MDEPDAQPPESLEPRPPTQADLVTLCRHLNSEGARYVIIGGFAIIQTGYPRFTGDIDLLVSTQGDNESKVLLGLTHLPDQAVLELKPGEIAEYNVIRVADEIVVDLMQAASGLTFEDAEKDIEYRTIDGIEIPIASPSLLWRMKSNTYRDKDAQDIAFLRQWFQSRGETPPEHPDF